MLALFCLPECHAGSSSDLLTRRYCKPKNTSSEPTGIVSCKCAALKPKRCIASSVTKSALLSITQSAVLYMFHCLEALDRECSSGNCPQCAEYARTAFNCKKIAKLLLLVLVLVLVLVLFVCCCLLLFVVCVGIVGCVVCWLLIAVCWLFVCLFVCFTARCSVLHKEKSASHFFAPARGAFKSSLAEANPIFQFLTEQLEDAF